MNNKNELEDKSLKLERYETKMRMLGITDIKLEYNIVRDSIDLVGCDTDSGKIILPNIVDFIGIDQISYFLRVVSNARYIRLNKDMQGIDSEAFQANKFLEEIVFNNRIKYIGESAFYETKIKKVNIDTEYGDCSIHERAFSQCTNLAKVKLKGVKTIGKESFSNNYNLTHASIEGTEIIMENAFTNCVFLHDIKLGEGLKEIRHSAFKNCGIKTVKIPKSVTTIEGFAFQGSQDILPELDFDSELTTVGVVPFGTIVSEHVIKVPNNLHNNNLLNLIYHRYGLKFKGLVVKDKEKYKEVLDTIIGFGTKLENPQEYIQISE